MRRLYTLVAYRSSWAAMCRNCVVDEGGSEFEIEHDLTDDGLVRRWSKMMADDALRVGPGRNWEFHVIPQLLAHDGSDKAEDAEAVDWMYDEGFLRDRALAASDSLVRAAVAKKEEAARARVSAEAARRVREAEERDLAEYERLRRKFEGV